MERPRNLNNEIRALVVPRELTEYEEDVRNELTRAFYSFIGPDLARIPDGERSYFLNRSSGILIDATKRGLPIIQDKLNEGPISVATSIDQAVKIYTLQQDDFISWKLTPKATDVFERVTLAKQIKESGIPTEGRVDLFTDQELLREAIREGLRQQEQLYGKFIQIYREISQSQKYDHNALKFLSSHKQRFDQYTRIYNDLMGSDKSEIELKTDFISQYVTTNHPLLDSFGEVQRLCSDVYHISNIFESSSAESYRNSLVITLLTSLEGAITRENFQKPTSSLKAIARVRQLVDNLGKDPQDSRINAYLIINFTLNKLAPQLKNIFTELDISFDIGNEFLFHLMLGFLNDMPGKDLIVVNPNSQQIITKPDIKNHYLLSDEDYDYLSASNRPQNKSSKSNFVSTFVLGQTFVTNKFGAFTPEQQADILKEIFSNKMMNEGHIMERSVETLMKTFGISFTTKNKLPQIEFLSPNPKRADQTWLNHARVEFLKVCESSIKGNDQKLVHWFDSRVIYSIIKTNLQNLNLPVEPRDYYKNFTNPNLGYSVDQLVDDLSHICMIIYYSGSAFLGSSLSQIIHDKSKSAVQDVTIPNGPNLKQLEEFVNNRVNAELDEVKKLYLPLDYEENKQFYLLQAISSANQ